METYNYDAAAVPEGDADTTPAAAPETDAAAAGTSDTAQSGFSSQPPVILTYPDSSSNDLQVSPGFGPYGDVMPSLPSNNHGSQNTGGCINCGGSNWKPSPNGALWTWGILSPFFSTSSEIAHLRFYHPRTDRYIPERTSGRIRSGLHELYALHAHHPRHLPADRLPPYQSGIRHRQHKYPASQRLQLHAGGSGYF